MRGFFAGFAVACVASLALLAGPASAATVICPPPPCEPSAQIACPLTATIVCGCPIALEGASLPVAYGCADLSVTALVDRATATVGNVLTYTVEVRNAGPDTATDTTLVDPLPAGLAPISASGPSGPCPGGAQPACALGALGPGEAASAGMENRELN